MPLAHETWFVPDYERFGLDWAFVGQTATLALLAAAAAITVAVRVLARRFPGVWTFPSSPGWRPGCPSRSGCTWPFRWSACCRLASTCRRRWTCGALPQAVVLIAGIPFNATLYFLGDVELMGHLPIYGTMLVLLVMGSDPRLRPLVSNLRPPPK